MRLAIRILAFSFLLLLIVSSFMAFLERSAVQKEQPERQLPAKTNKVEAVDSAGKGRRIAEVGRKAEPAVKMSAEESEALSILAKGDLAKERELTELYSKVLGSVAEEAQKMARMKLFVDAGKRHSAIRLARDLMDSEDPEVRKQVISTLRWYGVGSIMELTQMISDPVPDVQAEAMEAWQSVFDEFSEDDIKASTLTELIPTVSEREQIDALLMSVTRMRPEDGLQAVSDIIEGNKGTVQAESAGEMWAHLTDDYEYEGPSSVQTYLKQFDEEQQRRGEVWMQVRLALAENGGDVDAVMKLLGLEPILLEGLDN